MANDPVTEAVEGAKKQLASATKFTQNVEGNPTSAFAPKKIPAPKIPQTHQEAPYSLAHQAREAGESVASGLKAKKENVEQYTEATKNQ